MVFAVALYINGRFRGRMTSLPILTKERARAITKNWNELHAFRHDYREFDADNRLIWSEEFTHVRD